MTESRGWKNLLEKMVELEEQQEKEKREREILENGAKQINVFVTAIQEQGFTREEALEIFKSLIKNN